MENHIKQFDRETNRIYRAPQFKKLKYAWGGLSINTAIVLGSIFVAPNIGHSPELDELKRCNSEGIDKGVREVFSEQKYEIQTQDSDLVNVVIKENNGSHIKVSLDRVRQCVETKKDYDQNPKTRTINNISTLSFAGAMLSGAVISLKRQDALLKHMNSKGSLSR